MFTFIFFYCIINIVPIFASIAQLVECSLGKAEVTGSIPVRSPNDVSVRTFMNSRYKYHSEKGWYFFVVKISSKKKGWCFK